MDSNAHGIRSRPPRIKTLTIALVSALCSTLLLLIASSTSTHASPLPNQQSRTSFAAENDTPLMEWGTESMGRVPTVATHTLTKRAPVQPEEPLYALVRRLLPATYHSHFEFT